MTEISRFFGIIVRMYPEGVMNHHLPHFHVTYQGVTVSYAIDPIGPIVGSYRPVNVAWLKLGLSFTRTSYRKIGVACLSVKHRAKLLR